MRKTHPSSGRYGWRHQVKSSGIGLKEAEAANLKAEEAASVVVEEVVEDKAKERAIPPIVMGNNNCRDSAAVLNNIY